MRGDGSRIRKEKVADSKISGVYMWTVPQQLPGNKTYYRQAHVTTARVGPHSTIRKKMATGTFTYNALRTKTLKELIKAQRPVIQTRQE